MLCSSHAGISYQPDSLYVYTMMSMDSTQVGSTLSCKYGTTIEVADTDEHSRLLE